MSMEGSAAKCKQVTLTISEKMEIIKKLDKGAFMHAVFKVGTLSGQDTGVHIHMSTHSLGAGNSWRIGALAL